MPPVDRIQPGPGQESVWDYPRPPRLEATTARLRVVHGGRTVAETDRGLRVLETSQPPAYYFPPDDVDGELLRPAAGSTFCEWKGVACYFDVVVDGAVAPSAAWSYPAPTSGYEPLRDHLAFYAQAVDECWVGDDRVTANPGTFYGGWITPNVVGPFKGAPDTGHW